MPLFVCVDSFNSCHALQKFHGNVARERIHVRADTLYATANSLETIHWKQY